jgi:uncharacterized protein YecE (DUF72 family)
MAPTGWLTGCCGWAAARAKYFREFPVVELQTTFYQPPSTDLAAKWREQAPAGFVFTMKAWQLITHPASSPTYRRLKEPVEAGRRQACGLFQPSEEVWSAWKVTRDVARAVRAAVIVFQCPAGFEPTPENASNIERFFRRIERDLVRDLCRRLDLVHCVDPLAAETTYAPVAYFRLHGRDGYNYRYSDADLEELVRVCRRHSGGYVMFNNVHMLEDARRFRKLQ